MKIPLTEEQWEAMLPAISEIDGGCESCVCSFLKKLGRKFIIDGPMLKKVYVCWGDQKLDSESIEEILKDWDEV